jgi:hypothetical protein
MCTNTFSAKNFQLFKEGKKRFLVATDLFGRGMDIERVNIVFNFDMPENSDAYLHRVRPCSGAVSTGLPTDAFVFTWNWRRSLVPVVLAPKALRLPLQSKNRTLRSLMMSRIALWSKSTNFQTSSTNRLIVSDSNRAPSLFYSPFQRIRIEENLDLAIPLAMVFESSCVVNKSE